MTIDSKYIIQEKATDDETKYTFEFESLGAEVIKVYIVDDEGRCEEVPQA